MESAETAVYLFCFARETSLPKIEDLEVETLGAKPPLATTAAGGVVAVYGSVPLDDFTGAGAEDRFRDLDWVGPRALFHEKVIEEIARHSPVFPAPFGTIYVTEQSLQDFLLDRLDTISSFLDYVSDKREWAVKGFVHPERIGPAIEKLMLGALKNLPDAPGARYLQERRMRETASERYQNWLGNILDDSRQMLLTSVAEMRARNPLPESGLDEPGQMVVNWAFLVRNSDEQLLHAAVSRLNERHENEGIFFRYSGPWPPFSFTPPLERSAELEKTGEGEK